MANVNYLKSKIFVSKEAVQGQKETPVNSEAIMLLQDGYSMETSRDIIEQALLKGNRGRDAHYLGRRNVTSTLPIPLHAGVVTGQAPDYAICLEMGKYAIVETDSIVSLTGHTTSKIYIDEDDVASLPVGATVQLQIAGAYHLSPIIAIGDDVGGSFIQLLKPTVSPAPNGTIISAKCVMNYNDAVDVTGTITEVFDGNQILRLARGCRLTGWSLNSFTVNTVANFVFNFMGIDYEYNEQATSYNPEYAFVRSPVIMEACITKVKEGVITQVCYTEFTLSEENETILDECGCDVNGVKDVLYTGDRNITLSFNPKLQKSAFSELLDGSEMSIFVYAKNNGAADGEFKNTVAFYIPKAVAETISVENADGSYTEVVTMRAIGNEDEMLYITTI